MKASQELFYKNVNSEEEAQITEEYLNNSNSKVWSLCKDAAENSRSTTETGNEIEVLPGLSVQSQTSVLCNLDLYQPKYRVFCNVVAFLKCVSTLTRTADTPLAKSKPIVLIHGFLSTANGFTSVPLSAICTSLVMETNIAAFFIPLWRKANDMPSFISLIIFCKAQVQSESERWKRTVRQEYRLGLCSLRDFFM